MKSHVASITFLWRSCGEPAAAWSLVWMPLALLMLETNPTLASAMVRLLAVLVVAGLIWARGLGPEGVTAERVFVAVWAGSWAAALGALISTSDWPSSAGGSLGLFATLSVGAGWLGWAYHRRQEFQASRRRATPLEASPEKPGSALSTFMAWLLAALVFGLMLSSRNAHWGDSLVLGLSLGCFTFFQRGKAAVRVPTG